MATMTRQTSALLYIHKCNKHKTLPEHLNIKAAKYYRIHAAGRTHARRLKRDRGNRHERPLVVVTQVVDARRYLHMTAEYSLN